MIFTILLFTNIYIYILIAVIDIMKFNVVNADYFNIRTRSFNNLWYWAAQIIGASFFGKFLDSKNLPRRSRGIYGLLIIAIALTANWIGGLIFQLTFERNDVHRYKKDLYDSGYFEVLLLYIFYGLNDAIYQVCFFFSFYYN